MACCEHAINEDELKVRKYRQNPGEGLGSHYPSGFNDMGGWYCSATVLKATLSLIASVQYIRRQLSSELKIVNLNQ